MRTSSLALLVLAALSMAPGCLGNRPDTSNDNENDGGTGGAAGASGGAKGSVGGYGGAAVDAGAHDSGSGGVQGTGGQMMGAGGPGGGAGGGGGTGGIATGYGGAAGGGMGGAAGAGMGGAAGAAMGGHPMGGSGMGGASMGGSGMGGATGAGGAVLIAAALSGTTAQDFSSLSLGTASASFTWTIKNATGAMSTGAMTLTNPDPSEVTATNGCTSLAGGASCAVMVTFRPNGLGPRSATLTMSASPGGSVTLALTATGTAQVTVTTVGTGTVTSVPAGITCPGTCTATFTTAAVTLQARTSNGSNSFFSGWSDAACPGPFHDCAKTLTTASTAITATFSAMNANLIFGTLETYPTNLGGTAPYDAACNAVATAAGLNNAAGNMYIAMISDANSNGPARLGSARGWVRMDGKPFADTVASLITNNQIFYPFVFQEDGQVHNGDGYLTATNFDGTTASQNCTNWTDATLNTNVIIGAGSGTTGPGWLDAAGDYCGFMGPLICMGKSKSVAVTVPTPGAGRKIWSTSTLFTPGTTTTPNALCQSALPSGVTAAAALISTTKTAASSVLVPTTAYYRPDGVFVGTGADIAAMGGFFNSITSGVWQSQDGAYVLFSSTAWTGSPGVSMVGTTASTCGDWTDPTQPTGTYGSSVSSSFRFWDNSTATCALASRIFCVQTAP